MSDRVLNAPLEFFHVKNQHYQSPAMKAEATMISKDQLPHRSFE